MNTRLNYLGRGLKIAIRQFIIQLYIVYKYMVRKYLKLLYNKYFKYISVFYCFYSTVIN